MIAHDVYSEVNPAFCTCALAAFTSAYITLNKNGPELPLFYIALPLALSGDLSASFKGTNKNTGLREWLERSPGTQIALADRLNSTMDIVSDAIRFACFTKVLALNEDARLQMGSQKLKKTSIKVLSEESSQAIKHAERLGYWLAMAGSTRAVFDIMGLEV